MTYTYDAANQMTSRTNSLGPAGSLNVDPRDVFPMTHHAECVAILEPAAKVSLPTHLSPARGGRDRGHGR
ncbi:hypothetical protein ACFU98_14085 [Streptomyces sp. NPDC057575]|uniref:hypothetical protein n=1 Tax=unclassified Streptomyces TaxID=2593676 RepID=UPI00368C9025